MGKRSSRRATTSTSATTSATTSTSTVRACPCGLGSPYEECCGRYHQGGTYPATAELLMRSRYSAFAVQDADYLLRTWHSTTRPVGVGFDPDQRWSRLEIVASSGGGMLEPSGTVEFRAHYLRGGTPGVQHEVSRFAREDGRWVYVEELDS